MLRSPRPSSLFASIRHAWRGSLQLRVVTITLVATSALVATFGLFLSKRITDGLVQAKESTAVQTAKRDSTEAGQNIDAQISDPSQGSAAASLAQILSTTNSTGVTMQAVSDNTATRPLVRGPAQVPDELIQAVSKDGMVEQRVMLDIGHGRQLYLVVGREMTQKWGSLQLYYFFPFDSEISLANDFGNIITATGVALVIMLAAVAYLVTRMVVSPVRVAARTAQRLSNGLLDQRMEVDGEDDLAALAASFNQMAENLQRHILRLEEMSRLQRRFTSDVSHELRTPLTTVRMAADLIFSERDGFDAPVARSAELLQTELDRFEGLLAELLEISRSDAGFAALDAEPTSVGPEVTRAVSRLAPLAERSRIEVEVDLPHEPVVAEIDIRRIE